ncbi:MAG: hypothetical protein ACD_63C00108G0017 [uncultured bacterium]|nr:MAG: hypothetical protein ACD_63C00108G0017 [uncultured bacterium]
MLIDKYKKEIVPALMKEFGYRNKMAVPKLEKVVLNIGTSKALKDSKYFDVMMDTLSRITGQKPVNTIARKAISGFNVKSGMKVGLVVTLRKKKMFDFVEKLVKVALPRVRDFRGIPDTSLDKKGNIAIGFREHTVFPEINPDEVEKVHGLEVCIKTTANTSKEGKRLLELFGIPFRKGEKKKKKKRRFDSKKAQTKRTGVKELKE